MSGITFGTVGDIIAVCLLVKDIVEALDSSRGASAEYREIIAELQSLERSLLEAADVVKSNPVYLHNGTPDQGNIAGEQIAACRRMLELFHEKIKKFDSSLRSDSSLNAMSRFAMKVRWQLSEKENIARFRSELGVHCNAIIMALAAANINISSKTFAKLDNVAEAPTLSEVQVEQHEVQQEVRRNTYIVLTVRDTLNHLVGSVSKVFEVLQGIRSWADRNFQLNVAIYKSVLLIQRRVSSNMDRSLIQEPFVLEDPIGRISPVHLQFITSWDAFEAVLKLRFAGIQGLRNIEERKYALQEHATGLEIDLHHPWEGAFLPGQRIDMSIIFQDRASPAQHTTMMGAVCPRCQAPTSIDESVDAMCTRCGMYFRRITEIVEEEPVPVQPVPSPWKDKVEFGIPSFGKVPFGPIPLVEKRKRDEEDEEATDLLTRLRGFKRVRFISREKRAKFHKFKYPEHGPGTCNGLFASQVSSPIPWAPTSEAAQDLIQESAMGFISGAHFGYQLPRSNVSRTQATYSKNTDVEMDFTNPVMEEFARKHGKRVARSFEMLGAPCIDSKKHRDVLDMLSSDFRTDTFQYEFPAGEYGLQEFVVHDELIGTATGLATFLVAQLARPKHENHYYAIKVVIKESQVHKKNVTGTYREVAMLATLRHPFITKFWGSFERLRNVYLITELCEGGDLHSLLTRSGGLTEAATKFYAAEIVLALEYLHSSGIVYRSLRPKNILLTHDGNIRLCNFASAVRLDVNERADGWPGTPGYMYMAPEINIQPYKGPPVDWWALGSVMYECICSNQPFEEFNSGIFTLKGLPDACLTFPRQFDDKPVCRSLIEGLLHRDPGKRLGSSETGTEDVKRHPWFKEVDWNRLLRQEVVAPWIPPIKPDTGDTRMFTKLFKVNMQHHVFLK